MIPSYHSRVKLPNDYQFLEAYYIPKQVMAEHCKEPDHHQTRYWGRVRHICVSKLTIIGSDNGLSSHRRQAITWTNAGILLTGPLGTKFSEILIAIVRVLFKKMHLKGSSVKWRPFCLGLNVLTPLPLVQHISISESSQHWFRYRLAT